MMLLVSKCDVKDLGSPKAMSLMVDPKLIQR